MKLLLLGRSVFPVMIITGNINTKCNHYNFMYFSMNPIMLSERVNFSCKYPEEFNYVKRPGEHPVVTYTENTISRQSYICPSRFPSLKPKYSLKGPEKKAVTGIGKGQLRLCYKIIRKNV